jgi:hypothetical protein
MPRHTHPGRVAAICAALLLAPGLSGCVGDCVREILPARMIGPECDSCRRPDMQLCPTSPWAYGQTRWHFMVPVCTEYILDIEEPVVPPLDGGIEAIPAPMPPPTTWIPSEPIPAIRREGVTPPPGGVGIRGPDQFSATPPLRGSGSYPPGRGQEQPAKSQDFAAPATGGQLLRLPPPQIGNSLLSDGRQEFQ